ncbi:hypothetical protein WMY93_005001 [Mugilogobius chulae]|uniref:Ankyrin repeat domain-containing protein n=1 Tax=Mugilogobius chulae TaxID=88201 RepID=A0AAW0PPZ4_9GOBI
MSVANISNELRVKFPLHSAVWVNDYRLLEENIRLPEVDFEALDPRGRTPLHLAVSLGHLESVRVLLRHGAQVTKENAKNWTVLQEAVTTVKNSRVPRFYMEMKWEFTSWIPLVSRVCPSDVCRIWKSGSNLRVDATLLGFENMTWIRGRRSYIFRGDDSHAELVEVNHDEKVVDTERFNISQEMEDVTLESMQPAEQEVAKRLTTPIVNTYLDTKDIAFERTKSGIWGWRTERTEVVNGFEAKVFSVNNVNVVIRTRTEHLTDEEKSRIKSERNVLESLLGTVELYNTAQGIQRYLWMSEEHPLSLVEQVTPIIDLMARTSSHFARLRDFVTLKFPPGFPVKIEIPLFHVLNARITFGNVNKCSTEEEATPTPAGTPTEDPKALAAFQVNASVFEVPAHYQRRGGSRHTPMSNNDEELLQFAIHQSLLESQGISDQEGNWQNVDYDFTDGMPRSRSERSIPEGALVDSADASSPASSFTTLSPESDLRLAMELSAQAQEEEERLRKQEEQELERILQLSLTDK